MTAPTPPEQTPPVAPAAPEKITPAQVGKAAKAGLWVKAHWASIKLAVHKGVQKWKDQPVKTTGYGVIAAVVGYFAAEGIVDSNLTNLVTSLVTLGAGAPVVHAVGTQTDANQAKAREQGKLEAKLELEQARLDEQLRRATGE